MPWAADDAWPNTTRLAPWVIAGFVAVLWLVPFDAIELPVALPFDSKLDRVLLVAVLATSALHLTLFSRQAPRIPTPFSVALFVLLFISALSLALNLEVTHRLGDSTRGLKTLLLLGCYALFFVAVSRTLRPAEVRNFVLFILGLSVILSLGTLLEYRTGVNLFYDAARDVFGSFAAVGSPPADPKWGRAMIVGPGIHPLVPVTMLSMALPFAVAELLHAERRRRWIYALVIAVLLAGIVATIRKAAFVAPTAALLVLFGYRPRAMLRLAPLGLVLLAMVQVAAPGAAVKVKAQFINIDSRNTTQGRTADYVATRPDIWRHPLLGRGYGTYDPLRYRILDNQFLGMIITTGIVGLSAFILMLIAAIWTAHPVIRGGDPALAAPAMAAAGAALAFGSAGLLFDILSFPQVPYAFFFMMGLLAVVGTVQRDRDRRRP